GPAKAQIMSRKNDPANGNFYDLCFSKRPAIELYDCLKDPDQVNNLAGDPDYAEIVAALRGQLENYLTNTGDPRFTNSPVKFDEYTYHGRY
ncbi:MAG: hypothetical protein MI748_01000, partial [Opitutales bacterium]|nr:hypothetical protein [Opitutales bacterium]